MKTKQCVCGKYPKVKKCRSYSHTFEGWSVTCSGCHRETRRYHETKADAIIQWNERVMKDRARRDSKNKMIYDLEHSEYSFYSHGAELRDRALARLLEDVKIILVKVVS